jgi:MFS transporter, SHS family, lactate transporter
LPALLVFYIRARVPESPAWEEGRQLPRARLGDVLSRNKGLTEYVVILMTAFNFFSHGSQDLYPVAFLQTQLKFSHDTVTVIALTYNAGAIIGGLVFGQLSQRIGRRWAIVIAAVLALPLLRWWAFGTTPLEIGIAAFFMQVMVQGAWGVVPVHLNELSPPEVRATFPGFTYQLGNFLASANATIQYAWADALGNDLRWPLTGTIAIMAIVIALMVGFGMERHGVAMRTVSAPATV